MPDVLKLKGELATGQVWANGKPLSPERSVKAFNHSPSGFSWGFGGSGPAQLALAILLRYLPEKEAVSLHQDFKWKFIATLPQEGFETELDIRRWITAAQRPDTSQGRDPSRCLPANALH
jgi:hypothetical protein